MLLSPAWLTAALRGSGALGDDQVVGVEVVSSGTTPVSTVTRLALRYTGATVPRRLFLKTPKARLPREVTLNLGQREVRFYHDLAPAMAGSPLIRCYSAAFDAERASWHLLLDDVTDTHATTPAPATFDACSAALEALAAVHARWWNRDPASSSDADRQQPDEPPLDQWQERTGESVDAFAAFLGDRLSARQRQIYAMVVDGLLDLRGRRAQGPTTVVHGDAHLGNFLMPRERAAGPVYPCDWQDWWIAEPTRDAAYLIGKSWTPRQRAEVEQQLVRHYHARLEASGVDYPWDGCWDDYRYSVVNLLLVPMGQWEIGIDAHVWWPHLQQGMAAFDDLDCAALLRP
jgi:hypothetical protein